MDKTGVRLNIGYRVTKQVTVCAVVPEKANQHSLAYQTQLGSIPSPNLPHRIPLAYLEVRTCQCLEAVQFECVCLQHLNAWAALFRRQLGADCEQPICKGGKAGNAPHCYKGEVLLELFHWNDPYLLKSSNYSLRESEAAVWTAWQQYQNFLKIHFNSACILHSYFPTKHCTLKTLGEINTLGLCTTFTHPITMHIQHISYHNWQQEKILKII